MSSTNDLKKSSDIEMGQFLLTNGYFLVKVPENKAFTGRNLLKNYLRTVPETIDGTFKPAGVFQAFNLSSSYHSPAKRFLDSISYSTLEPVIIEAASLLGLSNYQGIPDRLCVRDKAQKKESYHTDNTSGAKKTDVFYGSILNLNQTTEQQFVCVPGSHKNSASEKGGDFTPLTPSEELLAEEQTIIIPPGHILLFNENIVHRVSGGKPKTTLYRNFFGFRITDDEIGWCPENEARFEEQAALAHKGGAIAPMFPHMWFSNPHAPRLFKNYCDQFIPEMNTDYSFKSGKRKGETITIPHKIPPSLTVLGKRYRDRTDDEKRIFKIRSICD